MYRLLLFKEIYYIPAVKYKKPGGCLYSKYHNQPKTRRDGLSDTESNHTQSSEKVGGKRKHRDTGTSKKTSDRPGNPKNKRLSAIFGKDFLSYSQKVMKVMKI